MQGGLGNQLFQYFNGLELSRRLNRTLLLDLSRLEENKVIPGVTPRDFELEKLGLSSTTAAASDSEALRNSIKLIKERGIPTWLAHSGNPHVVTERNRLPQCLAGGFSKDLLVVGNYQNPKFFSGVNAELVSQIRQNFAGAEFSRELQAKIFATNSVAVHVRRGDYLRNGGLNPQGVLSLDYYKNAQKKIESMIPAPFYFVFSDDPAWCKENMQFGENQIVVNETFSGRDNLGHFRLMSACKHFIVANSTFSWWCAWLGAQQGSKVIAPQKWNSQTKIFSAGTHVPRSWIRC